MKRILAASLLIALLLSGCSWMDGTYVHVVPHREQSADIQSDTISASNYQELAAVLEELVSDATETAVIDVAEFDTEDVEGAMKRACRYIQDICPMGAYAVEDVRYELGANTGRPAVAVTIAYHRSRMEIIRIRTKKDMDGVTASVWAALEEHNARVVVLVEQYEEKDFAQVVQDYCSRFPQTVMEVPQVSLGIYGTGPARVVELNFSYQNSRDALRHMRSQAEPVFEAAQLYVSGEGSEHQKLSQLSGFLTERFDYDMKTSITPAYSLLCHGVGDSRAFAEVYAAMCRRAGLQCQVVTGTRDAEPWSWNMVTIGEQSFHVDIPRAIGEGFRLLTDWEMTGYVWDYSAYPLCDAYYQEPAPETEPTEETEAATHATEPEPAEPEATEA